MLAEIIMKIFLLKDLFCHGPLARYVKLRVAHAPGMPGTFSPPPRVSDPDMHHGMCMTHVPWCMPGSLTSGFLWSQWRGKRSRHSRYMRNPQFYVSGKGPMGWVVHLIYNWTQMDLNIHICAIVVIDVIFKIKTLQWISSPQLQEDGSIILFPPVFIHSALLSYTQTHPCSPCCVYTHTFMSTLVYM